MPSIYALSISLPLVLLSFDSRSLASSGRSLGRVTFFCWASCWSWLRAWVWSFTIISANFFTWESEVFWAISCPNSTSALLPLAASAMKCWSDLLKEPSVLFVAVVLLAALPELLVSAGAGLAGLSAEVAALLLLQPATANPMIRRDESRVFFMGLIFLSLLPLKIWMAEQTFGMG